MKILITGVAGFIGHHLVMELARSPEHKIIGLDNINNYYDKQLKYDRLAEQGITVSNEVPTELICSIKYENYQFIKLDLTDKIALENLFKDQSFDLICNLAAQAGVRYSLDNPDSYIQSNIVGFVNLLECCRHYNVNKLIYASSSSVYGNSQKEIFRTTDFVDAPVSLYAATKKSNELLAHSYSHLYGIKTIGLRFFTVYGSWGRPDMAPILFAKAILENQPIKVFNYGNLERDFTHISDIINGIVLLINNCLNGGNNYRIFNIGNSQPIKLMDFIAAMEVSLGKTVIKDFLPMQAGDVYKTYADISELVNETGYKPLMSIQDGLQEFLGWFTSYYERLV
ncbi:NAD-dependent epimerase/dehydratase family protein [Aquella oligotrophica]|uniref:NAD-dependent epimerase n=1 Tax=Aquella oligotrophica TaxID=2067065 RepID=A0A2I7N9J8_9NEIS|nr:NAD-dependent epimerase/dehydratase family protein [Aquella oligotrophica]AUR53129.1 NAD-dependent epimerase [Aquella oligotrophica]